MNITNLLPTAIENPNSVTHPDFKSVDVPVHSAPVDIEPKSNVCIRASQIESFMLELRRIARSLLARERTGISVPTDALVNTAYLRNTVRNSEWVDVTWKTRQFFFADMIQGMRRSLIERVRRKRALKRPPIHFFDPRDLPIHFETDLQTKPEIVWLLEDALAVVEKSKPDLASVIKYQYYVGLTVNEVAEMFEVSEKTIDRWLGKARILLVETMAALAKEDSEEE